MNTLTREWLMLSRSRTSVTSLLLLFVLSAMSVWVGVEEVDQQRQRQQELQELQRQETAVLAEWIDKSGDAGYAAYYTFHPTWNPPSALAFAALGLRDVAPQTLRIRALGLEAQLYENENFNPELAVAGRFDFAFVVIYLLPLFIIALLHDFVSREREAGRLPLLAALSPRIGSVWWTRALLRSALVAIALVGPFLFGAWFEAAPLAEASCFAGVVLAYLLFWAALVAWVGLARWIPAVHAAVLVAAWAALTLATPTAVQTVVAHSVPVTQGTELTLAHRELVNAAWDQPKEATMRPFLETHPEWQGTSPVTGRFHWKWYYAFHHVADQRVADRTRKYRDGLMTRQRLTERTGWWLPPVGAQVLLHRLAGTDLPAQLEYEDAIRQYHARLRRFYYPYFFEERPFGQSDFDRAPGFAR
jgi:ABC-2 type transport system permease protein